MAKNSGQSTTTDPETTPESRRAKLLPGIARGELPLVPARMVNEVLYCERLMFLEWIQGEWDDNRFTADGTRVHKRVDKSKRKLKPAPGASTEQTEQTDASADKPYQARSVWLSSESLKLTAKLDVVDVEGGKALAVEYKRGKRPDLPEGAYLPERAQLCAHVLLLREHGYACDEAEIYFAGDHQRTRINIDDELIQTTRDAISRARELAASRELPPPLVDSPKCVHCSLNRICLPDETNYLRAKRLPLVLDDPDSLEPSEEEAGDFARADGAEDRADVPDDALLAEPEVTSSDAPRRLTPARTDKAPLYVTTQGAVVKLDGYQLSVFAQGEKKTTVRLPHTSHVSLFGNVQISTQAIRSLIGRGVGLHFFSYGGWWTGACVGADSNNVQLRLAQYEACRDSDACLALARRWIYSKIANCRTLLRRNHRDPDATVLRELKILARKAQEASSAESLLGIEGTAARTYFSAFSGMLTEESLASGFDYSGRNRRPPKDRLNALLSFSYSLLTRDALSACRTAGLDPLLGFYHQPQFGRPSLALDLMEEFRPLVADSSVLHAINNRTVQYDDFVDAAGAVSLSDKGRRNYIKAYEQRLEQEVTHPVFGYKITYRRVLEVQARLLGRLLLGELSEYPVFRTR